MLKYQHHRAQTYSCDLWSTGFEQDPMDPVQGRRFRYTVLQPGGSKAEMDILRDFLGREPDTNAFVKEMMAFTNV